MANANLTGNGTVVLNAALWAGVGGLTKVNNAGTLIDAGDTDWLQSPIGSNAANGVVHLGVVDVVVTDGDAAFAYDLEVTTNAHGGATGMKLVGLLSAHNITTAGGNAFTVAGNVSTTNLIKLTPAAAGQDGDTVRLTFLYRS